MPPVTIQPQHQIEPNSKTGLPEISWAGFESIFQADGKTVEAAMNKFVSFVCDEDSPTMVEYGLLIIVIALVVVAGATVLGSAVMQMFEAVPAHSN